MTSILQRFGKAAALVVALTAMLGATAAAEPDLVPWPKLYKPSGGVFAISGKAVFIEPGNRQCEIAAQEIAGRVRELGGVLGTVTPMATSIGGAPKAAGIYILTAANPAAQELAHELKMDVTPSDPGPQGYVIQNDRDRLVIVGSDKIGALYGAMTLRQMFAAPASGRVEIAAASIRDKPDYRFRSGASFYRGLGWWATGAKDPKAAYQTGIDWMMRLKINLLGDYYLFQLAIDGSTPDQRAFVREMNAYAVERGIYPALWQFTNVKSGDPKGPAQAPWDCVATGPYLFCWSRDDLAQKKIVAVMEFCRELNFKMLCLHPIDGGGLKDPELWSKRCARCRERWGDSERWKASAHQFNMWAKAIREQDPDLIFTSPIYVYVARCAEYEAAGGGDQVDRATWKQNTIDYWTQLNGVMDPMVIPQTWMSTRPQVEKYRACFKDRPIMIYAHSTRVAGYFGTWHRLNQSNYDGNPRDIYSLHGGYDRYEKWLNVICNNEFCWNTQAPGREEFTGLYYDIETEHTGPAVIMEQWVPRACRAFYGRDVGERLAPIYQAGVQPVYITDPGRALADANKYRRSPMADVDPTRKDGQGVASKPAAPDVKDSAARMGFQVEATRKALTALDSAWPYVNTLDPYRRRSVAYFYKRMPLWHMIAAARHAVYQADELMRDGRAQEIAPRLEKALQTLATNRRRADQVLVTAKTEPDLTPFPPSDLKRGDVKPSADELEKMIRDRLADVRLALKPRRPGEFIRVGIHQGLGQAGTLAFFNQFKNVKAELIDTLLLSVLDRFDCVFLLQTTSISESDVMNNVRRYVLEGGGGVVFQHNLCGFLRSPFGAKTPFPEICESAPDRRDARELTIAREHLALPGLKKGEKVRHMYYDHLILAPGNKGVTLAEDEGRPVVVAGEAGAGKVVFDGNVNLTEQNKDQPLTDFNASLARGAVEWMTGVRLQPKE